MPENELSYEIIFGLNERLMSISNLSRRSFQCFRNKVTYSKPDVSGI